MSKKEVCLKQCEEAFPGYPWVGFIGKRTCDAVCKKQHPNGGNDVKPKKEITQEIEQTQIQYQYELAQEVSVQAPFTYQPQTEKVYSPTYQLWSPGGVAGAHTEQAQRLDFNQILKTIQDIAQSQSAEQEQAATQTATISEEEKTAQSLLGALIIAGGIGAIGYFGYKELSKKKVKKGDKKNG